MAKEYELLSQVDFGVLRDRDSGEPLPDSEQPELHGVKGPGETVSLEDNVADPLLQARVIKPAGEDLPPLMHDNPEELGFEGEEARNADMEKSQEEADNKQAAAEPKGAQNPAKAPGASAKSSK
jgi:hypothetical protein